MELTQFNRLPSDLLSQFKNYLEPTYEFLDFPKDEYTKHLGDDMNSLDPSRGAIGPAGHQVISGMEEILLPVSKCKIGLDCFRSIMG